jgi:hypothetical protein
MPKKIAGLCIPLTLLGCRLLSIDSNAVPVLDIFDSAPSDIMNAGTHLIIFAQDVSDTVVFNGSVGSNWQVSATGIVIQSPLGPTLELESVTATSLAGGTLTIAFTEGALNGGLGSVSNQLRGTSDGTVSETTYVRGAWLFGTELTKQGPFGPGTFDNTVLLAKPPSVPQQIWTPLSEMVTFVHTSAGTSTVTAVLQVTVPDSASTLSLLGCGFVALILFGKARPLRPNLN